ncbi:MAG: hypothetical protein IMY76_02675, partial [Chloroflexi bacterium]|nr:hypothetical protein [Chloroflexota bacterium]
MDKRRLYEILTRAMVDANFCDALFWGDSQVVEEWMLTGEERAYFNRLPYEAFEKLVGSIISHWLIPMPVNKRYTIFPESAVEVPSN